MMDYTNRNRAGIQAQAQAGEFDAGLRSYMLRVYNHMGIGLALTGLVALFTVNTPALFNAIAGTPLMWVLFIVEIGLVFWLSARVMHMSESKARAIFYGYSILNGLTFSILFAVYTEASIARAFFSAAAMFGAMSLYGYTTKKDLTSWGSFLFMGLIGILIASIANFFFQSPAVYYAVSVLGVLIFVGLTAYDTQKIKETYYLVGRDHLGKAAISGALSLYLDFINLMIMMLRLIGERR